MKLEPLEQFKVKTLATLHLFGHDVSFTTSSLYMLIAVIVVSALFALVIRKPELIPGRVQAIGEIIYDFVMDTLNQNTMGKGERYFPFIFSLFCFIIVLNFLGLVPYTFAVTGQIAVTLALAMLVFIILNVIAFVKHGFKFFHLFLPEGVPLVLAPIMIVIELFVYLIRPITLSVRLAANISAGHVLLYVATAFIMMGGLFGALPFPIVVLFTGFELFMAALQAYIFTVLTCVYLNDAIHLHCSD